MDGEILLLRSGVKCFLWVLRRRMQREKKLPSSVQLNLL